MLSEKYDIIEIMQQRVLASTPPVARVCQPGRVNGTAIPAIPTTPPQYVGAMVRYKKVKIKNIITVLIMMNIEFQYGFDVHLSFLERIMN